jgi:hypothetical protein
LFIFKGITMLYAGKQLFIVTLVLATCGYAAVAIAQNAALPLPPTDAQPQMQNRMHMGDGSIRDRFQAEKFHEKHREERIANRQAMFKAKLKVTPAQESAWSTFAAAIKPPARGASGMGSGMGMGMGMRHDPKVQAELEKLTTPERIDKIRAMRQQRMTEMNALMDKRAAATKTFYAVLSSEQKAVFDAISMHVGRHGMRGEYGGHGGGEHRGWGGAGERHQGRTEQPKN